MTAPEYWHCGFTLLTLGIIVNIQYNESLFNLILSYAFHKERTKDKRIKGVGGQLKKKGNNQPRKNSISPRLLCTQKVLT